MGYDLAGDATDGEVARQLDATMRMWRNQPLLLRSAVGSVLTLNLSSHTTNKVALVHQTQNRFKVSINHGDQLNRC